MSGDQSLYKGDDIIDKGKQQVISNLPPLLSSSLLAHLSLRISFSSNRAFLSTHMAWLKCHHGTAKSLGPGHRPAASHSYPLRSNQGRATKALNQNSKYKLIGIHLALWDQEIQIKQMEVRLEW